MNWRKAALLAAVLVAVVAIFFFPAIPQDEAYHNSADQRMFLGIPNFLNVFSNVLFLVFGAWGISWTASAGSSEAPRFLDRLERWPYFTFFLGVALTAFGSAYYHLRPDDARLVWDRIPMTIGFMALVAAVISERIMVKTGVILLVPLVLLGVATVIYWRVTQMTGQGDLRPYALVQFGSLVPILILIALFPPRYTRGFDFIISLTIYGVAKVFEAADRPIFAAVGIVSGHTLKHIAAAISAYWILRMLRLRRPIPKAAKTVI